MVYKIVYKVIVVLLALSVIPIAVFSPMVQIVGSVSLGDTYVGEHVSMYDFYKLFIRSDTGFKGLDSYEMTDEVRETMPELITAGSFLGVSLLLGVATACTAAFSRKKLPVLILSAVGCLSVVGLFRSFRAFAAPYLDGTISLAKLGLMKEGILRTIVSAIVKLEILQISSAGFLLFGAFFVIVLWTAAFMLVELGETEKPKKSKA